MKRTFSIFSLLLLLLLCCAGLASAISVTATPPSANVGSNVLVNVSSLVPVNNSCQINVNFDDGGSSIINCTAGNLCVGNLNHTYTIPDFYTITATESGGCMSASVLPVGTDTVTVSCPSRSITTSLLAGGVVNQFYSAQLQSVGGIFPVTWIVSGDGDPLPPGLNMTPTGQIFGTPTASTVANVLFFADDSCGAHAEKTLPLTISCPAHNITTASLPGALVGQPYSAQLMSSGGVAPFSWGMADLSPPVPNGLTLSPTGLISGTPTTYGISNFSIESGDSCNPFATYTSKAFSINVAAPATAELTITRLQLTFDNGRAETTVNRNQPGLRANADLRFNGSGLLQGYWEVDGRLLSQVNQHLTYGKSIRLTSPAIPFLPTFVEGSHRVRLVITSPANEIPFPEAIYYVTSEESVLGLAPLRAIEPRNHAELAFVPQSFSWEGAVKAPVYLIEFFEKEGEDPVAAAYTKGTAYDLPEAILAEKFDAGKAYFWWVKSYDDEGNLIGVSELSRFIFQ